jgi:hypothetical protein
MLLHRSTRVLLSLTALAVVVSGVGPVQASAARGCPLPVFGPGAAYHPRIDASAFTADVTNPYFPLRVGTTYVYTGVKDGKSALDIVVASPATKVVDHVRTRVVQDRLYLDGVLEERTADYYAQDRCGTVWYFGEDTAELDAHGRVVSTEGSFHAGVDGAEPGVFMTARPRLGRLFRQEWLKGQAEDVFSAVDRSAAVSVPFGTFTHALQTREFTALEPGVVDAKYFVRGVGEVFEGSLRGPRETLRLVEIIS